MTEDDYQREIARLTRKLAVTLAERDAARQSGARWAEALRKIAFPAKHETNDLAGNPQKWSTTIAYTALGGRYEGGVRINQEDDLRDEWW